MIHKFGNIYEYFTIFCSCLAVFFHYLTQPDDLIWPNFTGNKCETAPETLWAHLKNHQDTIWRWESEENLWYSYVFCIPSRRWRRKPGRAQLEGYPLHIYETVEFSVACFGDRLSMEKNHLPDLGLSDFLASSIFYPMAYHHFSENSHILGPCWCC